MEKSFEKWWKNDIENNPLWKMSNENLKWNDVKIIAKIAYIQGAQEEFEKKFRRKL